MPGDGDECSEQGAVCGYDVGLYSCCRRTESTAHHLLPLPWRRVVLHQSYCSPDVPGRWGSWSGETMERGEKEGVSECGHRGQGLSEPHASAHTILRLPWTGGWTQTTTILINLAGRPLEDLLRAIGASCISTYHSQAPWNRRLNIDNYHSY